MAKNNDLTKITVITLLGLAILIGVLFWLKGYKFHNQRKIVVYFNDVCGLEEGAIVRWSGLRVGVVEKIEPILIIEKPNTQKKDFRQSRYFKLYESDLKKIKELERKILSIQDENEKNKIIEELEDLSEIAEIHNQQALAADVQDAKIDKSHVKITALITKKNVPLGPLSRVSIVPSGFIGDHYIEITPAIYQKGLKENFDTVFITQEPLRFERLLKANIESSEAFRDAITKVNRLFKNEDVDLLRNTVQDVRVVIKDVNGLINNASVLLSSTGEKLEQLATSSNELSSSIVKVGDNVNEIIGDPNLQSDLKSTAQSLKIITGDIAALLDEGGLANDIKVITENARNTSTETSALVRDLRRTNEELEIPKTIANLNSLAEKLDTLTTELNKIAADEKIKDDLKVTIEKSRQTSENLEKVSKKLNKRFLLFRLMF